MNEYVYIFEVPVVINQGAKTIYDGNAYWGVQFSQMTLSAENIIDPNVKSGSLQRVSSNKDNALNKLVISKIGEYAMSEFS